MTWTQEQLDVQTLAREFAEGELRGSSAEWDGARDRPIARSRLLRIFGIIFFTTAIGGLIFQSTTFSLPKIFDERLTDLASTATLVGWYAFVVFSVAAMAQLVVGYLLDPHSLRTVFAVVAVLHASSLRSLVVAQAHSSD